MAFKNPFDVCIVKSQSLNSEVVGEMCKSTVEVSHKFQRSTSQNREFNLKQVIADWCRFMVFLTFQTSKHSFAQTEYSQFKEGGNLSEKDEGGPNNYLLIA